MSKATAKASKAAARGSALHTPAAWWVREDEAGVIVQGPRGEIVCRIDWQAPEFDNVPAERMRANALMLAAAPALAEALEEALRMLREVDTSLGRIEEADAPRLYAALRAAGRLP